MDEKKQQITKLLAHGSDTAWAIDSKFEPIQIVLNDKEDCAIAVFHMWKYAVKHLSISQVFDMVNRWAYEQPEKEEVMRVIMSELVQKYCPHYTISVVDTDPAYQEKLREHRELAKLAKHIQSRGAERLMQDEQWGTDESMTFEQYMRNQHRERRE